MVLACTIWQFFFRKLNTSVYTILDLPPRGVNIFTILRFYRRGVWT